MKKGIDEDDWDKGAGLICNQCGNESFRIIEGMCTQCWNEAEARRIEVLERKSEKRYYIRQLMTGQMTLTEMKKLRRGSQK